MDGGLEQGSLEEWVIPGQRLGHVDEYQEGEGTYQRKQYIHASVVGLKRIVAPQTPSQLPTLIVTKDRDPVIVPQIGDVVLAKVIRVNPRIATVKILCVGETPLKESAPGIIRIQDVRATETDKVEISKSFRPGDIVRAEIISWGDARSYLLATSKNELGVIFAKSVSGATMVPISWEEMQCPKTKMKEFRKVAKTIERNQEQEAIPSGMHL